mgnify:CR=1 FL=1
MISIAMRVIDLGRLAYRPAWEQQERVHAEVLAGATPAVLLVEHDPVITMGRRGETMGVSNLRATADLLARRGVEFVQTDRGGDITFHGPGQLVAYPIVKLNDQRLSVGGFVRALQEAVIAAVANFGVAATTDPAGVGVWAPLRPGGATPTGDDDKLGKLCALGVRVKRGVTMHGLALNVTTDLSYFDLIVPCGIADRPVTSLHQLLGTRCPTMTVVKAALVEALRKRLISG